MSDDSLITLTAHVDRLLVEADTLKYGNHERLLAAAQEAGHGAQALGDFRRYAQALTHQAWALANLNRFEASLMSALEALQLAREYGFLEVEARVVGVMCLTFLRCGMGQEAAYLYEHQRSLGEQLGIDDIQAMALNDTAVLRMGEGDNEAALALLERAARLMPPDIHGGVDYSIVHLNLALAYIYTKHFDDAERHARQVIARAADAPKVLCDAHLWLASVCISRDDTAGAAAEIDAAQAVVDAALPDWYNDNIDGMRAELLMHQGRFAEAAQVWERMYTMTVERQEIDYAVSALNHLKDVYERIDDTRGLISAYKRLSEDIPRLQKRSSDLRFSVLRMVFAMDKAALQAELKLNQQKTAILERLSHEFRTPLAIIQSSSEIIQQYGDHMALPQRQARLQRITEQVQTMTLMLEDIVDLLQLDDSKDAPLQQTAFTLDALAHDALSALPRYQIGANRIRLDVQPDAGEIYAPKQALQTVLVHLLTNAVKFSQEDVTLSVALEAGALVLRVADQGIGIPQADQEAVFKPLVRGSNLDEVRGTGIGLAIVFRLVEQMRGSIDLTSAEGKGTSILVRVPLAQG